MRSLRSRPSRQIEEDAFIPTERKSSLRSQSFTPQQSKLRSTPNTPSSLSTTKTRHPKRYYISDTDNEDSEEEILCTPTKKAKTSRLARTRKALTSYPSPPSSQDEYNYLPVSAEKMDKKTTKIPTVTIVDLPLEIQQYIVDFLPNDKDVTAYSEVCRVLHACVTPFVFQRRFLRTFDPIASADAHELQKEYKIRQGIAARHISFERNDEKSQKIQKRCLEMLKAMIMQANGNVDRNKNGDEIVSSFNHNFFFQYFQQISVQGTIRGTDLLDNINGAGTTSSPKKKVLHSQALGLTVKLCFIHLILHPEICNLKSSIFHTSQQQAYKCFRDAPLFFGRNRYEINMPWLLHVANFFRFHFKTPDGEGILAHMYSQLETDELPRPWIGQIKSGTQALSRHWKGAFTFLHEDELEDFRTGRSIEAPVDETTEGNDGFQDLTIFSDIRHEPSLQYPPAIEGWLDGSPMGDYLDETGEKITPVAKDFFGLGRSEVNYHLHGRMHALPPQQGISGFQRVSMMKYLPDEDGKYGTSHAGLWAYEGCILPGNHIMLGRWWSPFGTSPSGRSYGGPFIYWNVSGSPEDKIKTTKDAVAFLDQVEQNTI